MAEKKYKFPQAKRPGEYVSFFILNVNIKDDPASIFLACDAFSEFGFHTGIEMDEKPETILKHIYLLTEHPDFKKYKDKGFTLVLDRFEELSERILIIIASVNGKLLFDKEFNARISAPMIDAFSKY